jgi:phage gp45-like
MFKGFTTNMRLNLGQSSPCILGTLNYDNISNYRLESIPVSQPYGYCGIAPDGEDVFYNSLGNNFDTAYISGYWNTQQSNSNLSELTTGETATFNSTGFTRQLKLDGAYDIFTGATQKIKTKVINGENTNQILIDILDEIESLETYINTFVTLFNAHIHSGGTISGSTGNPATPETPYIPTVNYIRDKTFLNTGTPNYIDTNGKILA